MSVSKDNNKSRYQEWYDCNNNLHNLFASKIKYLTEDLLKNEDINYSEISSRVKEKDSFIAKALHEKYENPILEIMDVVGIRIVLYNNTDVEKVSKLIESEFNIDKDNSMNKADIMKVNEVGYLSVHYVAQLKEKHFAIATYKSFEQEDIKFEIQIRSILQHAWAEIEHDQNYKYKGELPEHLKRKFNILAAGLELIDNNFDNINNDLNIYSDEVKKGISNGNYNFKIDTVSVYNYFEFLINEGIFKGNYELDILEEHSSNREIINCLKECGINSLQDLNELLDCRNKVTFSEIEDNLIYTKSIMSVFTIYMFIKHNEKFNEQSNKHLYRLNKRINKFRQENEEINSIIDQYL